MIIKIIFIFYPSLESLKETHRAHLNEHNMTVENLNANKTDFEQLKKQKPLLEKQYIYFQDMKAYIRDFIDCYNEKMTEVEKTELSLLNLYKQRAERLLNGRLQDIKDQNLEATNSKFCFIIYFQSSLNSIDGLILKLSLLKR